MSTTLNPWAALREAVRRGWRTRSPRERGAIVAAVLAFAVGALYFGVWEPLGERAQTLRAVNEELRDDLAWMEAAAARIDEVFPSSGTAAQVPSDPESGSDARSLLATVGRSLRSGVLAGSVKRLERAADGAVEVHLREAPADAVWRWLDGLALPEPGAASGRPVAEVVELHLEPAKTSGRVHVRATLRDPA